MELYIYTKAPDPAQACATSQADLALLIAALADPSDATNAATQARISASIPQLGLNDDEALTLRFYDDASTEASWPADAANSLAVSLGGLTTDGSQAYTSAAADTIVSTYRTGYLPLTTAALKSYLAGYARRGFVSLWLHIRRTDSTGYRTTYVLMPVQVSEAVLNSAITSPDTTASYLTAAEIAALYLAKADAYYAAPLIFFGNLTDEQSFGYFKAQVATRVYGLLLTAQTVPTGAAVTVDLVNGAGTEQSKVATLAAGAGVQETIFASPLNLAAGDVIRGKIKSVGSTIPGGWLTATPILRPNT